MDPGSRINPHNREIARTRPAGSYEAGCGKEKVLTMFLGLLVDGWFTSDLRLTGIAQRLQSTIEKSLNLPKSNGVGKQVEHLRWRPLLPETAWKQDPAETRDLTQSSKAFVASGRFWITLTLVQEALFRSARRDQNCDCIRFGSMSWNMCQCWCLAQAVLQGNSHGQQGVCTWSPPRKLRWTCWQCWYHSKNRCNLPTGLCIVARPWYYWLCLTILMGKQGHGLKSAGATADWALAITFWTVKNRQHSWDPGIPSSSLQIDALEMYVRGLSSSNISISIIHRNILQQTWIANVRQKHSRLFNFLVHNRHGQTAFQHSSSILQWWQLGALPRGIPTATKTPKSTTATPRSCKGS